MEDLNMQENFSDTQLITLRTGTEDVFVRIVKKPIRTMRLTIRANDLSVHLSAPRHVEWEAIQSFVRSKTEWIHRHRTKMKSQPWIPPLRFEEGEGHFFLGERYTLRCIPATSTHEVLRTEGELRMTLPPRSRREFRRELLETFYRTELRRVIAPMIEKYGKEMGVSVNEWGIKKMISRWGSCNFVRKRLWFNLELAKYPLQNIEHVVVHEMVHLLEPSHNARFRSLMDHFFPVWRSHPVKAIDR